MRPLELDREEPTPWDVHYRPAVVNRQLNPSIVIVKIREKNDRIVVALPADRP